ncbi:mitochondrial inner membrane protein OXA1-like [Panicum miliaceum]|uniref:Mitochondrial inner membrane protein OXA1-like n=1 Tax=Panicum miliaceum TaxID=4540 RepID=A0A3L6TSU1_PANMI|nr:mitochondrial inner membrane protein OXA1-like [Panicum miliaceum]
MAFPARRRLATSLSDHFSRRLHPSISHLIPPHHDRSESPSSSAAPPSPQLQPARPSRPRALTSLPLPFALHLAAHRDFSTRTTTSSASAPDIDVAADTLTDAASSVPVSELLSGEVVSAAASVPVTPAPYAGEVAAAAAESFPPVAALQYLLDAAQSFTGLNWWATIALTTVLLWLLTVPMLISQMKSTDLRPEIEAINEEMQNSTDPRSMEVGKQKLGELFIRHGVTPFTPLKGLFIQGPIFMSFFFALNMQDGMEGSPMAKSMKKFSRLFGVMFVPFTIGFPKAIFFYWVTSNLFSLVYGVGMLLATLGSIVVS